MKFAAGSRKGFLELPPADFALLIDYTLRDPSLVDELRNEAVGDALLASRNKQSALNFVRLEAEGPPSLWPTARMVAAAMPVLAGDLPWPLYWRYYSTPSLILLSLVVALSAVAVLSVWFYRRRQRAMRTIDHRDLEKTDHEIDDGRPVASPMRSDANHCSPARGSSAREDGTRPNWQSAFLHISRVRPGQRGPIAR